ncbi:hypothetical protein HMPREF9554_02925 [Treponema phagedenis F0421]|nr:hypothetical protein HMPREF9554_02925 [Treponema phagedenis F0421]
MAATAAFALYSLLVRRVIKTVVSLLTVAPCRTQNNVKRCLKTTTPT